MRLQLSFELMLYMAMAGISMLISLRLLASYEAYMRSSMGRYAIATFVENTEEAVENGAYSFAEYVPAGLCNATSGPGIIHTQYGAFYLSSGILIKMPICHVGSGIMTASFNAGLGYVVVNE